MADIKAIRRAERLRWARELRQDAEELAPGGLGLPNDCDVADRLIGWAEVMEMHDQ